MHKGKNLYSEQEAVIMGFIKELKIQKSYE